MGSEDWSTDDSRELYLCSERQVRGLEEEEWARWVRLERLNQDQIELFNINERGELVVQLSDYLNPARPLSLQKLMEWSEENIATIRFPELIERQLNRLNLAFSTSIFWESAPHTAVPEDFITYHGIYPFKVNHRREVLETIAAYDTLSRFPIDPEVARRAPVGRHKELMQTATRPGPGLKHISPLFGMEAGSRPELLLALAFLDKQRKRSDRYPGLWDQHHLLVLNGPKDPVYIRTALEVMKRNVNCILVVDAPRELDSVLEIAPQVWPDGDYSQLKLGVRIKTLTRGSGAWEESGGKEAKFGLCGVELYNFFRKLIDKNLVHALKLLHFHVGSQLVEWENIIDSTVEAARLYLELKDKGFHALNQIDIGGGLAYNYDQHLMKEQSSALYDHEDYADMVVRSMVRVLLNHVKDPADYSKYGPLKISSESGRFITAPYTILAGRVIETRDFHYPAPPDFTGESMRPLYDVWRADLSTAEFTFEHRKVEEGIFKKGDPAITADPLLAPQKVLDSVLWNLHRILRHFGLFGPAALDQLRSRAFWKPNTNEFFDLSYLEVLAGAIQDVERYVSRIGKHSLLSFPDRLEYELLIGGLDRLITTAFRYFCEHQEEIAGPAAFPYHPFIPSKRYIVNFSTFGQLIDTQLVDQYFPVVPLSHLDRKPDFMASIGDLTCDSDGEIKKFVSFVDRHWGLTPEEISLRASVSKCFTAQDHKVMAIPGERLDLKGIPVHAFDEKKEKYFVSWLFLGAYQDVLRTRHNLFGAPNTIMASTRPIPWMEMDRIPFDSQEFHMAVLDGENTSMVIQGLDYNLQELKERIGRILEGQRTYIKELFVDLPYYTER